MNDVIRCTHVALLRGINVGGNNLISMRALQACLTKQRFEGVRTYIQSGNVLFASRKATAVELEKRLEQAIERTFGCSTAVVVYSARQMRAIVEGAPAGFGHDDGVRYNVLFCKRPMTPKGVLDALRPKPDVDEATVGAGVVYAATLKSKATQSSLPRFIGTPAYRLVTIRNWNTTQKLDALMAPPS